MSENTKAKLNLRGVTYELEYSFTALLEAEETTGCNLLSTMQRMTFGQVTAKELRGLLYAMIVPYRGLPDNAAERMTAVGDLIGMDTIGRIYASIGEAFGLAVSRDYLEQYGNALSRASSGTAVRAVMG